MVRSGLAPDWFDLGRQCCRRYRTTAVRKKLTRRANHVHKFIIEKILSRRRETGRGFFESGRRRTEPVTGVMVLPPAGFQSGSQIFTRHRAINAPLPGQARATSRRVIDEVPVLF